MAPWCSSRSDQQSRRQQCREQSHQESEQSSAAEQRGGVAQGHSNDPFVAFRQFADQQVRILVDGLATVPTILSDLKARGTDSRWSAENFTSRADQPLAFMSQHFEPPLPPDARPHSPPTSEAIAAARILLRQSRDVNAAAGVKPEAILALYRETASEPLLVGLPGLPHNFWANHSMSSLLGHVHGEHPWLSIGWFQHSRYAPAQLETDFYAHQHGSMWRAAFEDLLSASLGKEEESRKGRDAWTGRFNDQARYAAWAATPRDWMLGLQCRGILPPQLPSLYETSEVPRVNTVLKRLSSDEEERILPLPDFMDLVKEVGTFDADERPTACQEPELETPQTELDAYERFLGQASDRAPPPAASKTRSEDLPKEPIVKQVAERQFSSEDIAKSKILSTLSTTERTTLPDGTVTTKVVLRKRFADGREESTETVSTTHGDLLREHSAGPREQPPSVEQQQQAPHEKAETTGRKGWFWF